jgi:hypothetical protein
MPKEPEVFQEPTAPKEPEASTSVTTPDAAPIAEVPAASQNAPQGFPPPGVAPAGAPQAAPQGFPPPGAPQGMPQDAPQNAYQAAPAYSAAPPAPKKKKTGIIIAIVVVLLLLCGTVIVGGLLIYRGAASLVDSPVISNMERHTLNNDSGNNSSNSSRSDNLGTNRAAGDNVLLDTDGLTITVDLDSAELIGDPEWYQVLCTVENKTDIALGLYFDYDTNIDGLANGELEIVIFPDSTNTMFAPNTAAEGVIAIFTLPSDGTITNLEGILVIYDNDTFETVAEYPVSMPKLYG